MGEQKAGDINVHKKQTWKICRMVSLDLMNGCIHDPTYKYWQSGNSELISDP